MEETPKSGYFVPNTFKRSSGYYFVKIFADSPWRPFYWDSVSQTFDVSGQKISYQQVAYIHSERIKTPNENA